MVNLLVSACLLGENCKYSGGNNYSVKLIEFLEKLGNKVQVIPVCPEAMGGLKIPRSPAEIRLGAAGKTVWNKEGKEVTAKFQAGAEAVLKIAVEQGCKAAILKERSPSCGSTHIYDGSFTSTVIEGMGLTAQLLAENGIPVFHEENFEELREYLAV